MRTGLFLIIFMVAASGIALLIEPGLSVLVIAAVMPIILVEFWVQHQRISENWKCVEDYRRHTHS